MELLEKRMSPQLKLEIAQKAHEKIELEIQRTKRKKRNIPEYIYFHKTMNAKIKDLEEQKNKIEAIMKEIKAGLSRQLFLFDNSILVSINSE